MKRCPVCKRVENDDALAFCRADGTPLASLVNNSSSIETEAGTIPLGWSSSRDLRVFPPTTDAVMSHATAPTTALPSGQAGTPTSGQSTLKRRRAKIAVAVIVTAVVAAVTAILINSYRLPKSSNSIQSIAVLPFENASGNAELDYLSDGVSESVIDRLSQLSQLKVIARTSSFQYRGQNLNLKKIADALGVQAVITGRVVQRADSYQIRVDVTDARENKQIWGANFTRKASDVQVLQTDIAREIAENLRLKISGTQMQQFGKQPANPKAYELVLKGIFYRNKGSGENLKKSIECFQQAIAADPNYAPAYAGLADSYRFAGGDPKEQLPKREAAIRRALDLDDTLSEAHFSMGQYQRDLWSWQEAEREYRRAMQLNPNSSHAHSGLSGLLSLLGRHGEAIAEDKRATELDPVGVIANTVAGRTLHFARRYDEAVAQLQKTIEFDQSSPTAHLRLADVYVTKRMYREAVAEYQLTIKLGSEGRHVQTRLGAAYAKMGERQRAFEILKQSQTSGNYVSSAQFALLYAALGETEQAFVALERAYAARDPQLQFLNVDPAYDSLRSDPRFEQLLKKIGFRQ